MEIIVKIVGLQIHPGHVVFVIKQPTSSNMAARPKFAEGQFILQGLQILNCLRRPWLGREEVYAYELSDGQIMSEMEITERQNDANETVTLDLPDDLKLEDMDFFDMMDDTDLYETYEICMKIQKDKAATAKEPELPVVDSVSEGRGKIFFLNLGNFDFWVCHVMSFKAISKF